MKRFFFARVGLLLVFLTGSGCKKASVTQQPPLQVNVVTAIEKEVREWDEFIIRLDPIQSVYVNSVIFLLLYVIRVYSSVRVLCNLMYSFAGLYASSVSWFFMCSDAHSSCN